MFFVLVIIGLAACAPARTFTLPEAITPTMMRATAARLSPTPGSFTPAATVTPRPTYTRVVPLATRTPSPLPAPTLTPVPTFTPEPWHMPGQRYYFPVQPPDVARYSDEHHDYPATDIFVPVGSTVVAVTDGVVNEVRSFDPWNPQTNKGEDRPGLFVAIVGDDGVRYHTSHLSAVQDGIELGARVRAGQVIGLSGKTGNARNTPAHVHFGISRPVGPGDWEIRRGEVWPFVYLKAWTAGEALTPILPALP